MVYRFKPRVAVHPDRLGPRKTQGPNRLMVIHTSEGGELPTSAEALCTFMQQPGDRPSPSRPGKKFGSSYHYVTDTDEGGFPAVPEDYCAYAAAGANAFSINFCIPGKAGQSATQWLDDNSTRHINWLGWAMKERSIATGIPLVHLTDAQIKRGEWGYCDHHAITRVYHQSDHTDVGDNFPWEYLANLFVPKPGGTLVDLQPLSASRDPRMFDTLIPAHSAGRFAEFQVTDPDAVNAKGLLANFTLQAPAGTPAGFATFWRADQPQPVASKLNWTNDNSYDQIVPNELTVWLSPDRRFRVFTTQAIRLVCDVTGYWV